MAWSLRNLFKFKTRALSTTYDSHNHEVAAITAHSPSTGIRCELSKTVFPFLQITAIRSHDGQEKPTQFFTTLSLSNSVFQFCFDSGRSYQLKSSLLAGPIVSKIHSIVSAKNEVYGQFESMYHSAFYNIGFKLISPTFQASNLIYIVNYWRALGRLCFGFEVVGMDNELGLSFSSRMEGDGTVCCVSLQRLNLLTLSLYKRIFRGLELGVEARKSPEYSAGAAGLRMRTLRTDIRCSVDQRRSVGFSWDEKLSESLTVSFSSTYGQEGLDYGVGIFYGS